jgi:hypothetical protein
MAVEVTNRAWCLRTPPRFGFRLGVRGSTENLVLDRPTFVWPTSIKSQ